MANIHHLTQNATIHEAYAKLLERRARAEKHKEQHKVAVRGYETPTAKRVAASIISTERKAQSDWKAVAVVLVIVEYRCNNCKAQHTAPQSELMVRRYNLKNGTTWEAPSPEGLIPPHLIRETRFIKGKNVGYCHLCFAHHVAEEQLTLFNIPRSYTTYDAHGAEMEVSIPDPETAAAELHRKQDLQHALVKTAPAPLRNHGRGSLIDDDEL